MWDHLHPVRAVESFPTLLLSDFNQLESTYDLWPILALLGHIKHVLLRPNAARCKPEKSNWIPSPDLARPCANGFIIRIAPSPFASIKGRIVADLLQDLLRRVQRDEGLNSATGGYGAEACKPGSFSKHSSILNTVFELEIKAGRSTRIIFQRRLGDIVWSVGGRQPSRWTLGTSKLTHY